MPKIFLILLLVFLTGCSGSFSYRNNAKCAKAQDTVKSVEMCAMDKQMLCVLTPQDLIERKDAYEYLKEHC